jgi:hypothetical protein
MACTEFYFIHGSEGAEEVRGAEVTAIIMDREGMSCVGWIFVSNASVIS